MPDSQNPCYQIQVDLSAMLDGELDAASVRRVMVHSEVCDSCRSFLRSIRSQARAHQELALCQLLPGPAKEVGKETSVRAAKLRQELMANRDRLARILYELGRGFVLMGLSEDFSKVVAREPVPIPDMCQRGKILLDETERLLEHDMEEDSPWVHAKDLFDQGVHRTPAENLDKGRRLLIECLMLTPERHEARIYLGMVFHVQQDRSQARREFAHVLAGTVDPNMRAFALLNMGNVYLEDGEFDGAISLFSELVDSGVIDDQPRFGIAYFNLALAYGLQGAFYTCFRWFEKLHDELPHLRARVARELARRSQFLKALDADRAQAHRFAAQFPVWFPANKEAC